MKQQNHTIWIATIVISLVITCGFVLQYNTNLELQQEINSVSNQLAQEKQFSIELNSQLKKTQEDLAQATTRIDASIESITSNIKTVEKTTAQNAAELQGQIQTLKTESTEQIKKLTQEINVQSQDFSNIIPTALKSVVIVQTDKGIGSGAIITRDGYIVTNHHVIEDATTGSVRTSDGVAHQVRIVGVDKIRDIAVLHIEGTYQAFTWADSSAVVVGQRVAAIGSPAGLSFSVNEGIISATRTIQSTNYIQTDVALNPGNSGGPLINKEGQIVGINNFKLKGFEGLNFAITSNDARDSVEQIIANEKSNG